jgi:DNA polymerase (family 10)
LKSGRLKSEAALYRKYGLGYIEPELRDGQDEVQRAKAGTLPVLVTSKDIRGDLHAHSMSSDGVDSIEDMAEAARERGYGYIGVTDHSQSLKIAGGVSVEDLWAQIRFIDKVNGKLRGFQVLKSSEVDILVDGSLDYPDELLRELDYTVCSIHSRFGLGQEAQTERILRAMDNRYFNILGHATGRLLLKRPGYEIDIERVITHARQNGCFFEINSSPDRLDLSAENARRAAAAGVLISISTDSHSTEELALIRCGIDQARRAGLEESNVLNCLPWKQLQQLFRR